jgi:hypothetical protein
VRQRSSCVGRIATTSGWPSSSGPWSARREAGDPDDRRRSVRASLAELAELSADEFPLASSALQELLSEQAAHDPAKDEIWVSLVVGLAHEQLEDALGEGSLD